MTKKSIHDSRCILCLAYFSTKLNNSISISIKTVSKIKKKRMFFNAILLRKEVKPGHLIHVKRLISIHNDNETCLYFRKKHVHGWWIYQKLFVVVKSEEWSYLLVRELVRFISISSSSGSKNRSNDCSESTLMSDMRSETPILAKCLKTAVFIQVSRYNI